MTKAAVHSLVFALIFYFTYGYVWRYFNPYPAHRENMTAPPAPKKNKK
jgi:hypothetical protein